MNIINYVLPVLSFLVGLTLMLNYNLTSRYSLKEPTLDNIETTTFMDDNNVCYKYSAIEIEC